MMNCQYTQLAWYIHILIVYDRYTKTKLVILDFLSSQPIEHLTARNAPGDGRKSSSGKVWTFVPKTLRKIGESCEASQKAVFASSAKRSWRVSQVKTTGKVFGKAPFSRERRSCEGRSYLYSSKVFTEGDAYFKRSRTISNELKKGITEFSSNSILYPHTWFAAFFIESMYNKTNIKTILHGGLDMNFIFEWWKHLCCLCFHTSKIKSTSSRHRVISSLY